MPELLLEVGCEELPATFVARAVADLADLVGKGLAEAGLAGASVETYATPRRLIVAVTDVPARQEDRSEEKRGPALKGAFDAEGNPTKALEGFLRGQGATMADVRRDEQYVWVTKHVTGRPASEVVPGVLEAAIKGLTFPKTMRWGGGRMRFARPIRWLLAAFDGAAIPVTVESVTGGGTSRGHRFYAPDEFPATTLAALLGGLRERQVEPDPEVRKKMILDGATAVAAPGTPDVNDDLLEENVHLSEWPTAIVGTFPIGFMELPEPVLVTAMAKHERMFPVRGGDGKLTNRFVFVRNSGEDETVRRGAEWVLNARFNDARFFYELDRPLTMDDHLAKTEGILFAQGLGTVRQRADRLSALAVEIARQTGADEKETEYARLAGLYAKADLASGLVSELSSLQGIVGGAYARREGIPGPVAWALETQYDPGKNPEPATCEGERTALRLIMADALDKLAGYLGQGKEPTGSSDPFALRRAVTILIEAAWIWPGALPAFDDLFGVALDGYAAQGVTFEPIGARRALYDIFASRYGSLMPDVRHDVLRAALLDAASPEVTLPRSVRLRTKALAILREDATLVSTATRPMNLVIGAKRKGIAYGFDDPLLALESADLDSAEGDALKAALKEGQDPLFRAAREEDVEGVVRLVRELKGPVDRFVDTTMIMAEDENVRFARLTLCHAASLAFLTAGDFTALEG